MVVILSSFLVGLFFYFNLLIDKLWLLDDVFNVEFFWGSVGSGGSFMVLLGLVVEFCCLFSGGSEKLEVLLFVRVIFGVI